jgi:hypothetical protein
MTFSTRAHFGPGMCDQPIEGGRVKPRNPLFARFALAVRK